MKLFAAVQRIFLLTDAVHRIFFEHKEKHVSWVGVPSSYSFSASDIQVLTSNRPDKKKQLLFAATRFKFTESMRGVSRTDGSSMLQFNATNLRKNA